MVGICVTKWPNLLVPASSVHTSPRKTCCCLFGSLWRGKKRNRGETISRNGPTKETRGVGSPPGQTPKKVMKLLIIIYGVKFSCTSSAAVSFTVRHAHALGHWKQPAGSWAADQVSRGVKTINRQPEPATTGRRSCGAGRIFDVTWVIATQVWNHKFMLELVMCDLLNYTEDGELCKWVQIVTK